MIMKRILLLLTGFSLLLLSCTSPFNNDVPTPPEKTTYKNPVVAGSLPDPTVIRGKDGNFYVYATEDTYNVPIMASSNLASWHYVARAFTDATRPRFEPTGNVWAPDINYIDGKYVMYYAMSTWGGIQTCGIGVAVADAPGGPFTDLGKMFRSNEIGVTNSIDPSYFEYDGKKYIVWGSFHGIYAVQLKDDGLSVVDDAEATKIKLAGTAFEAPYIHKHGDYYYLFASWGSCCNGAKSTYRVVVGRSKDIWGPYVNKEGEGMLSNNFSVVISPNDTFVGNGHNAGIIQDDAGQDWILYHGIEIGKENDGRFLLLDQLKWDENGWPYIEGGSPSTTEQPLPVFNKK